MASRGNSPSDLKLYVALTRVGAMWYFERCLVSAVGTLPVIIHKLFQILKRHDADILSYYPISDMLSNVNIVLAELDSLS